MVRVLVLRVRESATTKPLLLATVNAVVPSSDAYASASRDASCICSIGCALSRCLAKGSILDASRSIGELPCERLQ